MGNPVAITQPILRDDLPLYPHILQLIRVTSGTVPGPSGYASSSIMAPLLYIASTQQLHSDTLLPRDREPCLALDVTRLGLAPGYYLGRLSGSYQSLPVYEVAGAAVSPSIGGGMTSPPLSSTSGLTQAQIIQLQTLSPSQLAMLENLTPCQLVTLVNSVPISQIHTLTSGVLTPTQISTLVNLSTTTQVTNLYTQLTTSQLISLTTNLDQVQLLTLMRVLTAPQIQTLVVNLTAVELQTLANLPSTEVYSLVTRLTTAQLITYLDISPLPLYAPPGINQQTGTTYTITAADLARLITLNNSSAIAISVPAASSLGAGWTTSLQNIGTGTATLTPTSGTINGAASLAISSGQGATIVSDGTNWQVSTPVAGATGIGGSSQTEGTIAATGSIQSDAASLTYDHNRVTGADNTKGVILRAVTGAVVYIWNDASSLTLLNIYPPSGEQFVNGTTNAPVTNGGGTGLMAVRFPGGNWLRVGITP